MTITALDTCLLQLDAERLHIWPLFNSHVTIWDKLKLILLLLSSFLVLRIEDIIAVGMFSSAVCFCAGTKRIETQPVFKGVCIWYKCSGVKVTESEYSEFHYLLAPPCTCEYCIQNHFWVFKCKPMKKKNDFFVSPFQTKTNKPKKRF